MVFAFSLFCQKTVDGSSDVNSADSSKDCLLQSRSARPLSATSAKYGNVKNSSCSEGSEHLIALLGIRNSTTLKIGSFMLKRDLICLTSSTRNSKQAFLPYSTASGSSFHSWSEYVAKIPMYMLSKGTLMSMQSTLMVKGSCFLTTAIAMKSLRISRSSLLTFPLRWCSIGAIVWNMVLNSLRRCSCALKNSNWASTNLLLKPFKIL